MDQIKLLGPKKDLDQNGLIFDQCKVFIHNNVVRKLPLPKYGLASRGTFGIEGKLHYCYEQRNTVIVSISHESWGMTIGCDLVDGSGLTPGSIVHLESSGQCKEVRQNILGIS